MKAHVRFRNLSSVSENTASELTAKQSSWTQGNAAASRSRLPSLRNCLDRKCKVLWPVLTSCEEPSSPKLGACPKCGDASIVLARWRVSVSATIRAKLSDTFRTFSQCIQAIARRAPQIRPRPLSSRSLPVRHESITLPFEPVQSRYYQSYNTSILHNKSTYMYGFDHECAVSKYVFVCYTVLTPHILA